MTEPTPRRAVLIVEHDAGVRTLLARLVSRWGCEPLLAESEPEGLHLLEEHGGVGLVLSDFQPGPDGDTIYAHLRRLTSSPVPPVLCTRPAPRSVPEDVELVPRPFDVTLLRSIIDQYVHGVSGDSGDSGDSDDSGGARPTG